MKQSHKKQNGTILQSKHMLSKGFTLIEQLIVVTILAIAAAMIFFYLDPPQRLQQARNVRRINDVEAIAEAIAFFKLDEPENFYYSTSLGIDYRIITRGSTNLSCGVVCTEETDASGKCQNISDLINNYLPEIPLDPTFGDETSGVTGYYVGYIDKNIIVGACQMELGIENELPTIEVIR